MFRLPQLYFFCFLTVTGYAQVSYRHPSVLGIHLTYSDFSNQNLLGSASRMDAGLALSYLNGISQHIDGTVAINGCFADRISETTAGTKTLLLQSDASFRARLLPKSSLLNPFLSAGLGSALYKTSLYPYGLLGGGIELHYRDFFIVLSAQYRPSFTEDMSNHYFYSLGIAGLLSKRQKTKVAPSAPLADSYRPTDRDGDGILDTADRCPDQPGLARFEGCPDTDGDGIEDKEDQCVSVFGFAKYGGCPVPDRDKDGINDEEDACLETPGVARLKGCPVPDTDGDGLDDDQDSCLTEPGPLQNKGCPSLSVTIKEKIEKAARNIFFKTGSYELLPQSYGPLDSVVRLLTEHLSLRLEIEGHTDNVGTENANRLLSENRAKSVKNYLVEKGIDTQRLSSTGYGQKRPVADNATPEGRARNRRVVMVVH